MNRRSFMGGLFGTAVASTVVSGQVVAGNAFDHDLTPEEQAVFRELAEKHYIAIPSRKSFLMTDELRGKGRILKRLVYKNRVCIDFSVARPNDETSETCLVFYMPHNGTPLDSLA